MRKITPLPSAIRRISRIFACNFDNNQKFFMRNRVGLCYNAGMFSNRAHTAKRRFLYVWHLKAILSTFYGCFGYLTKGK